MWAPGSSVTEVSDRFSSFPGIGRKKAAMAVELLINAFGVELGGMESGTVAYDVQVRRVFLRAGLVDRDTPADVWRAAALARPEAPGSLDLPTWLIGRETCRPRRPQCDACRLCAVCPRRVWLTPEGVGGRRRNAAGAGVP
jgi:endonuclease III